MPNWKKNKPYRDAGKGMPCMFLCGRDTTDYAHIRLPGMCGMGLKPPDVIGIDACHKCHEKYGHMNRLEGEDVWFVLLAFARTKARRQEQGWIQEPE